MNIQIKKLYVMTSIGVKRGPWVPSMAVLYTTHSKRVLSLLPNLMQGPMFSLNLQLEKIKYTSVRLKSDTEEGSEHTRLVVTILDSKITLCFDFEQESDMKVFISKVLQTA